MISARAALTRLIPLAMGDTGQARRVANFLMAWWNGPELGHFEIADMFGLDIDVANDITSVIGFLGQNDRGAVYIDGLGFAEEMQWMSLPCGGHRQALPRLDTHRVIARP